MKTKRIKGRQFNVETIDAARQIVKEWFQLDLTFDQMVEVIASNDSLARELRAEMNRELMAKTITQLVMPGKRRWPMPQEDDEHKRQFFTDFFAAAKAKGWTVLQAEFTK